MGIIKAYSVSLKRLKQVMTSVRAGTAVQAVLQLTSRGPALMRLCSSRLLLWRLPLLTWLFPPGRPTPLVARGLRKVSGGIGHWCSCSASRDALLAGAEELEQGRLARLGWGAVSAAGLGASRGRGATCRYMLQLIDAPCQ